MLYFDENDVFLYLLAEAVSTTEHKAVHCKLDRDHLKPSAGLLAGTVYQFEASLLRLGKDRPHRSPNLMLFQSPLRWIW